MKPNSLDRHAIVLLVGFAVQFLAGMTLNLFVTLPSSHPGTTGNDYFVRSGYSLLWALSNGGGVALTVHACIALGLFLGCLTFFVRGVALRSKLWGWSAGIASLFTLGALFNGLSFADYSHDFSSMIMAVCWLVAVATLATGLILSLQAQAKADQMAS